jgi:hypothetical protein
MLPPRLITQATLSRRLRALCEAVHIRREDLGYVSGRLADPQGSAKLIGSTRYQRPETLQIRSAQHRLGDYMCFVPTSGKPGEANRRYVRKPLIHSKTVTKGNKGDIAKALGIEASKLKTGKKLHIAHD